MWNGGVSDSEEYEVLPESPLSLLLQDDHSTAPERFATVPPIATTYSARSLAAFSISAVSHFPSSNTTWIIPERSLTSTNTRPPLLRFFLYPSHKWYFLSYGCR